MSIGNGKVEMKNKYPSIREIRDAHAWKRDYEKYLPVSRFLFRPVGFWGTWVAVRIGLTTEAVSWLSGFVGLSGCLFLAIGGANQLPFGIALLLIFNLLDCVDGSIARTMQSGNPYGIFLDSICGSIVDLIFWGIIGVMAFRHPDLLLFSDIFGYGPIFWLILGVSASYLCTYLNFVEKVFDDVLRKDFNRVQSYGSESPTLTQINKKRVFPSSSPLNKRTILVIIATNFRARETFYLFLVVAYISKTVDLLLGFYFLFYLLHILLLIITYAKRGISIKKILYSKLQ